MLKKINAIFVIAAITIFIGTNAFASSGKSEIIFDGVAVSGTGSTVTSRVFNVGSVDKMGYWFKATKAATPEGSAIRMSMEGSYDGASTTFATMQTVVPNDIFATTSTPYASAGNMTVPSIKYIRFVAEGITGNATGTTVTAYLYTQEKR